MAKKIERLHWPDAPDIWAPFIPIIKVAGGTTVYLAGMTAAPMYHHPHRPEEFTSIPDDMEGQVREIFKKMKKSLETAGATFSDVVWATRYLKDVTQQDVLNKIWNEQFGDHRPTTTTIQVERFAADPKLLLEVTVIAVID